MDSSESFYDYQFERILANAIRKIRKFVVLSPLALRKRQSRATPSEAKRKTIRGERNSIRRGRRLRPKLLEVVRTSSHSKCRMILIFPSICLSLVACMMRLVGPMGSALRLLDIITKKRACFFGCSSERFCRFCGPVIPNRWHGVAVRHVWCCERCLSAPRLGRYRLAVSHVSRRETCLTARWNMKFGE